MKNLITILAMAIMLMAPTAWAGASFQWDANPPAENVLGYIIYFQDTGTQEVYNYNVGNVTTCTDELFNFTPGRSYDMWVKAYNAAQISGESNHVQYDEPEAYTPPDNKIPVDVSAPSAISGFQKL